MDKKIKIIISSISIIIILVTCSTVFITYYHSGDNNEKTDNEYDTEHYKLIRHLYVDKKMIFHFTNCLTSMYLQVNKTTLNNWYHYLFRNDTKACCFEFIKEVNRCNDISLPFSGYILQKSFNMCKK
jgi:hypothetical protein